MINTFIAAIIAIFFWGKTTKEIEEKTETASLTRTIIYLFLSIIVGVFFYKTYQTAIIYNIVDIDGVRQSYDESGNIADTVSVIRITNKFKSGGIINDNYPELDNSSEDRHYKENGGVYAKIMMHNKPPYLIKANDKYKDADLSFCKFDDVAHAYQITAVCTSLPSLIPLFPSWEKDYEESKENGYARMMIFDVEKHPEAISNNFVFESIDGQKKDVSNTEKNPFENAYYATSMFVDKSEDSEPYSFFYFSMSGNFLNNMNFFTAADVSQYIQAIQVTSNCPVKLVEVKYDLDIEVTQYDSCMDIGPWGFGITGDYLKSFINKDHGTGILVKLPTNANLQLIRSLILTTLITAFISLFLSNLFFWLRKQAIRFREKYILVINEEKVKSIKRKLYVFLGLVLAILLWLTWRIYNDRPLHIPVSWDNYFEVVFIIIILVIGVVIYFMFRNAYIPKKKKSSGSKSDNKKE